MNKGTKWAYILAGCSSALMVAFGSAFVLIPSAHASANTTENALSEAGQFPAAIQIPSGYGMGLVWPGSGDSPLGNYEEALAEVLGISVDELQDAYKEAQAVALQKAVDDGLLTQDKADELLGADRLGAVRRLGFRGPGRDQNPNLAEALGISAAELEVAQNQALETVIDQAVEDGKISQEQADLMLARNAIQDYMQNAMAAAYEEAVRQAVSDGVITQGQADQLLSSGGPGLRSSGGFFGGRGRLGPNGELHGPRPTPTGN